MLQYGSSSVNKAMAVVPGSVDGESFHNFIVDDVVSFLLVICDI
jgi:hypothetical protein